MESSDDDVLTSILDRCNRDRVASILGATPQKWTSEGEGSAAVLVPLVTAEKGPSVLFTLRSRHVPPPKPSKVRCLNRVLSRLAGRVCIYRPIVHCTDLCNLLDLRNG